MDIWSIGITILELCDGKLPHSHLNPMRAIFAISKSDAPKLSNTGRNGKVNTYRTLNRRFFHGIRSAILISILEISCNKVHASADIIRFTKIFLSQLLVIVIVLMLF